MHAFGYAIFQTVDVLMCDKLYVVKLEVEKRLTVHNLQDYTRWIKITLNGGAKHLKL